MGIAMIAIRIAARLVPRLKEPRRLFWEASSFVLTRKDPMMEQMIPTAASIWGTIMAFIAIS